MRRLVALTFVGGMLLAGCATVDGEVGEPVAGTNAPDTKPDAAAAAADEKPAAAAADEQPEPAPAQTNAEFGGTFTYDNGLSVTVSAPEPFTPSEWAAKGDEPSFVKFDVTVVNGTQENYDPSLFYLTMQSGNVEAESVYDSENGIEGSPSTPILPGREGTWVVGFGVMDPSDLVMQVQPDMFNLEDVIYTS